MTDKKSARLMWHEPASRLCSVAVAAAFGVASSFVGTPANAWSSAGGPGFFFQISDTNLVTGCEMFVSNSSFFMSIDIDDTPASQFDSGVGGSGYAPVGGDSAFPPDPSFTMTASTLGQGCFGGTAVENFTTVFDTSLGFSMQTEISLSFCIVPAAGTEFINSGVDEYAAAADGVQAFEHVISITGAADAPATSAFQISPVASCAGSVSPEEDASTQSIIEDDLLATTIQTSRNASNISRRAAARLRRLPRQSCEAEIAALLDAQDIRFANDSFVIDARNDGILDSIATVLGNCDKADFLIAGHTDWNASDAYNNRLSQNRVDAVKAALVRRGVAGERLTTRGFGESQPIASNKTAEGRAANRRVEFIQISVDVVAQQTGAGHCVDGANTSKSLNVDAENGTGFLTGVFGTAVQNCASGTYVETWLDVDVSHVDVLGTQARVTLGFSKEIQEAGKLRGYFIEGYAQRTSIGAAADGSISGFGIHAGLFGAHAVQSLTASYYASGAVGHHRLDFDTAGFGDGEYTYFGVFLGGALTGERAYTWFALRPSLGIGLGYGDSLSADIADVSDIRIDAARYVRVSASVGFVRPVGVEEGLGTLALTPRVFCETSSGTFGEGCGIGGSVEYDFVSADSNHAWSVGADYDWMDDASRTSASVSRSKSFANGSGASVSSLNVSQEGSVRIDHDISLQW